MKKFKKQDMDMWEKIPLHQLRSLYRSNTGDSRANVTREAMIKTIKRLPQYNLLSRAVKAMPIQQPQTTAIRRQAVHRPAQRNIGLHQYAMTLMRGLSSSSTPRKKCVVTPRSTPKPKAINKKKCVRDV